MVEPGRVPREVTTTRLRLRVFRPDDIEWYAPLCADVEVMHFLGGPQTRDRAQAALDAMIARWESDGVCVWAAEVLPAGPPIGFVGLSVPHFLPSVLPAVEVGWRLARSAWGHGYATEGAQAGLDAAWDAGLDQVISISLPDNHRSHAVMERLGLQLSHRELHPRLGTEVLVHAIDRSPRRPPD